MNCSYLTNRNPFIVQHVELRPIDSVIPLGHNPRTNSEAQIGQIAASIREFGFVNPILIGDDGVIVAGHARLSAALKLHLTEVPVIVLSHLTDAQLRRLPGMTHLRFREVTQAGW